MQQRGGAHLTRQNMLSAQTLRQLESSFGHRDARFGGLVLKLKDAISDEEPP